MFNFKIFMDTKFMLIVVLAVTLLIGYPVAAASGTQTNKKSFDAVWGICFGVGLLVTAILGFRFFSGRDNLARKLSNF